MNVFHKLWVIQIRAQVENSCTRFASSYSHRLAFLLPHWVLLGQLDSEWKPGWLSWLNSSFFHQEIIVAGAGASEAHFFTSSDCSGCNHSETISFTVELGDGASVIVVVEVVQEWHQSVGSIAFLLDSMEMLVSEDPCLFVVLESEVTSRLSWHFLLENVEIGCDHLLQVLDVWA